MSFNRLTIQSLQAERQRVAYNGLSGLGAGDRPTVDYVKAGDVVRVYVFYSAGLYFSSTTIPAAFVQNLRSAFNIVRAPSSAPGGERAWIVDVQPRSDYNQLGDVVSVVLNAAQRAGLNVNAGASYGQFVSQVETGGTVPPVSLPTPSPDSDAVGRTVWDTPTGDSISNFISSLTKSPVTLAVIAGAAVLLVIAAKK